VRGAPAPWSLASRLRGPLNAPIRFRRSNLRIAVAEIIWPSLSRSPRMRTQPHLGLSLALSRIRLCSSGSRPGRPGPRRRSKAAHFLRTSWRCQLRTVSGWDQHSDPNCPLYSAAQRGHDRPVGHVKLRPLHFAPGGEEVATPPQGREPASARRRRRGEGAVGSRQMRTTSGGDPRG
jgi:hypothetical protein